MPSLRDTLELMYSARQRFQSIAANYRYWFLRVEMEEVQERWIARHQEGPVMPLSRLGATATKTAVSANDIEEHQWRVLWSKPTHWRYEQGRVGRWAVVSIINGASFWYAPSPSEVFTNVRSDDRRSRVTETRLSANLTAIEAAVCDIVFLDPSSLLSSHSFQLIGSTQHLGRDAIQVRAWPRPWRRAAAELFFWSIAERYEILVDAEMGVLLSYTAVSQDADYASVVAEQIAFNTVIPEGEFVYTPSAAQRVLIPR